MSLPQRIAVMVVTGVQILGKATAAAGQQAVRNFRHKPEGAANAGAVGTGSSSKSQITNQLNMSLDEAHLILNVKKDDPLSTIEQHYETIFTANSPPAEPTTPAPTQPGRRPTKTPTHSLYLQSKVYRALERIKAERGDEGSSIPPTPPPDPGSPAPP